MKTINLKFTAILLIMAGLCSCSPADRLEKELEKEPEEPVTVPLTEYSLEGTGCQWTGLSYDNTVIIINSREDLEKYLTCTEGDFPEVDFSEHTLLLASGRDKDVINIDTVSLEYAANEYTVKVTVYSGSAAETENWDVAVLTSKIPDKAVIRLDVELELSQIDFNNIKNLYAQPLPVIQKAVQGKWKWISYLIYHDGGIIIDNGVVEISKDEFTTDKGVQRIVWQEREVRLRKGSVKTYVMCENPGNVPICYFDLIRNDTLRVCRFTFEYDSHQFIRIKNK